MSSPSPEAITAASKSNLALAFVSLPPDRKRDINLFYAFCRVVDDIADDPDKATALKRRELDTWAQAVQGPVQTEPHLAAAIRDLIQRREIPASHFLEIIQGVTMDLDQNRYATFDDLRLYCHRVASVVGLVSIEIFGYKNLFCRRYAECLGLALQLTNILRDVAVDLKNGGRIYLPQEDLARFGLDADTFSQKTHSAGFLALMKFEARRAESYFVDALRSLPPEDRRSMVAAEIMRRGYHRLLVKMQRDGFQVFEKNYRLTKPEKLWIILRTMWLG